ncbi:hypothetical protein LOD99_8577 [Oopsacas minuta]|uniref:Uncharacterized protein n=1 Tax=Oopsacas minuta TaxID=111878 RepID=A0AAV7JGB5_9METZ|nr:hypothetical protein LOD99_8577 [Oopsacas minuta]
MYLLEMMNCVAFYKLLESLPTTFDPTYIPHPLHSPLASLTIQLTFSLPQTYVQATPTSQYPDTNIVTENYKALNQSVTTFSTGQISNTRTPVVGKRYFSLAVTRKAERISFHNTGSPKSVKCSKNFNDIADLVNASNTLQSMVTHSLYVLMTRENYFPHIILKINELGKRHIFITKLPRQSPSVLERIDLQVHAIEANKEARIQIGNTSRRRRMGQLETTIKRFYLQL